MEANDVTIEVLKNIRDEIREVRVGVGETNARLDDINSRLDETNARLDGVARRVVESEIRTSTAIADLAGSVREMTSVLRQSNELRPRVERCEHEIAELKRHIRP